MEKIKKVILVSGMSGAGKSTATSILEDMGYHIIENYPVQLLSFLVFFVILHIAVLESGNIILVKPVIEFSIVDYITHCIVACKWCIII